MITHRLPFLHVTHPTALHYSGRVGRIAVI